jgi:hypothetical protein
MDPDRLDAEVQDQDILHACRDVGHHTLLRETPTERYTQLACRAFPPRDACPRNVANAGESVTLLPHGPVTAGLSHAPVETTE